MPSQVPPESPQSNQDRTKELPIMLIVKVIVPVLIGGFALSSIVILMANPRLTYLGRPLEEPYRWLLGAMITCVGIWSAGVTLFSAGWETQQRKLRNASDLCFFLAILSISIGILIGGTLGAGAFPALACILGDFIFKLLARRSSRRGL